MATYKNIQGYTVQKLSSDPPAEQSVGQLWYNSTSGAFKIGTEGAGAWSSGGDLNTGRDMMAGVGTATAALSVGGEPPVSGGAGVAVEQYDGSTWTTKNSLTTYRYGPGASGTSTACLFFGGTPPQTNKTEKWDGTNWTEVADLNTPRAVGGGSSAGTSAAAAAFGGYPNLASTEIWNDTCWATSPGSMNQGRDAGGGCGTSTAAQYNGGGATWPSDAKYDVTEQFNGSTWSEVADLNTARDAAGYMAPGGQSSSMAIGGKTPSTVTTVELWDGTSWTTGTVLPSPRSETGTAGSGNASAIAFGGTGPSGSNHAETFAWTDPVYTIKTVTVS